MGPGQGLFLTGVAVQSTGRGQELWGAATAAGGLVCSRAAHTQTSPQRLGLPCRSGQGSRLGRGPSSPTRMLTHGARLQPSCSLWGREDGAGRGAALQDVGGRTRASPRSAPSESRVPWPRSSPHTAAQGGLHRSGRLWSLGQKPEVGRGQVGALGRPPIRQKGQNPGVKQDSEPLQGGVRASPGAVSPGQVRVQGSTPAWCQYPTPTPPALAPNQVLSTLPEVPALTAHGPGATQQPCTPPLSICPPSWVRTSQHLLQPHPWLLWVRPRHRQAGRAVPGWQGGGCRTPAWGREEWKPPMPDPHRQAGRGVDSKASSWVGTVALWVREDNPGRLPGGGGACKGPVQAPRAGSWEVLDVSRACEEGGSEP